MPTHPVTHHSLRPDEGSFLSSLEVRNKYVISFHPQDKPANEGKGHYRLGSYWVDLYQGQKAGRKVPGLVHDETVNPISLLHASLTVTVLRASKP